MATEVILPRVDMDMTAGRISKWHVKDGDRVSKGAVIFEIETDKAAMEIEAPTEGVIRTVTPAAEASIPVGSVVAFIYAEGEAQSGIPRLPKAAQAAPSGPIEMRPLLPVAAASAQPDGVRATPLARKLARAKGVPLDAVAGSGPRGRIVAEDVRRQLAAAPAVAPADDAILSLYEPGTFELVAHDGMRRTIARRLVQAKQTVPHFYLTVTCDLESLLAARHQLNAHAPHVSGKAEWKISLNDLLIKALALALKRVPEANATWTEAGLLRHRSSDIGVAVAVEGGLFTPVIRAAETKSLPQISVETKDLAHRARNRKLLPHDYQGGTSAISNLGMFGVERFAAIINPPQASILAVGAGIARPAAVDGEIKIRTQMTCTLSCDHRVIDGAVGADLLGAFKMFVESPILMLA